MNSWGNIRGFLFGTTLRALVTVLVGAVLLFSGVITIVFQAVAEAAMAAVLPFLVPVILIMIIFFMIFGRIPGQRKKKN